MPRRQPPRPPLPRVWLMTDERSDDGLEAALARLPRGAGVIFRHHATPPAERRRRYEAVRRIARARGLMLVLASDPRDAIGWRADGVHGGTAHLRAVRPLIRTAPAHDRRELLAAVRRNVDLILLSPVFPTRSHPGVRVLGPIRFGLAAKGARVLALGGMDARRFGRMKALGAYGWAAIDAWSNQKRKVVPR